MLTALWIATAAAQQTWPADATLDDALRLQVSPQGLSAVADIAGAVVPSTFDIPTIAGGTLGDGFPGCLTDYGYEVTNGAVDIEVLTASIVPSNGVLTLQAQLDVTVNSAVDPMILELGAVCIEGDCDGYIDTFRVDLTAPITLAVVNGTLTATIGQVTFTDTLIGDDVNITNCTAASIVNGISAVYDVYQLLVDYARDEVSALLPGFVADFQPAINDALAVASYSDSIDLLGSTLYLDFEPTGVSVTPAGLDIQVGGRVAADPDPCVAPYDLGGSRRSSGIAPAVNTLPAQTHVGARISADIVDQGLYAVWRSGLLCYALEGGEIGGFTLDTALLVLIGGEEFESLFPETKPLTVRTVPTRPPLTVPTPDHDLAVAVDELGLDFYAELEGRQARALGLTVSPQVGLDVAFASTTGALAVELALPEAYNAQLRGDALVPDIDEVVANVEGIVSTLAATALTGALGDSLSFDLPSVELAPGTVVGVQTLAVTGTTDGWTTAEVALGDVPYTGTSCAAGGCSGSAGCATPGSAMSWGGGLLAFFLLRRRRG